MSLDKGYIKLWRSMLSWEWYDDPPTMVVYVHLILSANIDNVIWHGIEIPRGSVVSSYAKIAERTGLTIRQTRTAISHLELTGEVTRSAHSKFSVFTLNNYDKFQEPTSKTQSKCSESDKHSDNQPTSKRQQNKKDKKNKKEEYISAVAEKNQDVEGYVFIPDYPRGGNF